MCEPEVNVYLHPPGTPEGNNELVGRISSIDVSHIGVLGNGGNARFIGFLNGKDNQVGWVLKSQVASACPVEDANGMR